jgi:hypothetical protein
VRLIESIAFINPSAKELSMIASNMGRVRASQKQKQKQKQKKKMTDDSRAQGPMSQQGAAGSHGREMHPQKLVRLVGCHEPDAGKQQVARRIH